MTKARFWPLVWLKSEGRIPEGRKKSEIRNPKKMLCNNLEFGWRLQNYRIAARKQKKRKLPFLRSLARFAHLSGDFCNCRHSVFGIPAIRARQGLL